MSLLLSFNKFSLFPSDRSVLSERLNGVVFPELSAPAEELISELFFQVVGPMVFCRERPTLPGDKTPIGGTILRQEEVRARLLLSSFFMRERRDRAEGGFSMGKGGSLTSELDVVNSDF